MNNCRASLAVVPLVRPSFQSLVPQCVEIWQTVVVRVSFTIFKALFVIIGAPEPLHARPVMVPYKTGETENVDSLVRCQSQAFTLSRWYSVRLREVFGDGHGS